MDFDAYKNMVGAFHMPSLVYMNLETLKSLPERQFASGNGRDHQAWIDPGQRLLSVADRAWAGDADREYDALLYMVSGSCQIKKHVVEQDPTEQGIRSWLNFGHTIGHAVEKLKEFTLCHGECVAIGSVAAAWISRERGYLTGDELLQIEKVFQNYHVACEGRGIRTGSYPGSH